MSAFNLQNEWVFITPVAHFTHRCYITTLWRTRDFIPCGVESVVTVNWCECLYGGGSILDWTRRSLANLLVLVGYETTVDCICICSNYIPEFFKSLCWWSCGFWIFIPVVAITVVCYIILLSSFENAGSLLIACTLMTMALPLPFDRLREKMKGERAFWNLNWRENERKKNLNFCF